MKRLLIGMLVVAGCTGHAQNFEGTIRWAVTSQVDPAVQAQIDQMMERMNDPQMKAMMDANPQMKAQMEKMAGGGSMMPTAIQVKIQGKNSLSIVEGGMMSAEVLTLADKDQTITINRDTKTYTVTKTSEQSTDDLQINVTKTNETARILNYNCTKFVVQATQMGQQMEQFVWATTEIEGLDWKSLATKGGSQQMVFIKDIEGIPLKIEMDTPQIKMSMEAKEIKKEKLSATTFSIPSGFTEMTGMEMMGR